MKKGMKWAKGIIASVLAAAFIVSAVPANTLTAKAATKVTVDETVQQVTKRGTLVYKETGNTNVTITPGILAKNILSITINDQDLAPKNIKCSKKLRYKRTYKEYDDKHDTVTYRYSFYTTTQKRFKFRFTVDGTEYSVFVNSKTPVAKATFAGRELSTKFGFGTSNYITDITKGRFNVTMSKNYALESIQVGKYKNVTDAATKEVRPVLYWKNIANNKNVKVSGERQVSEDKSLVEDSMYATTILRVNYRYLKNNTTGRVDYYINRIVDTDN